MLTVVISMCVFAFVGAVTPGPVNIISASSGARTGLLKTLPYVLGATVSYTLVVALVGAGLSQVLKLYPVLMDIMKYVGSGYLLYLAYVIGCASPADLKGNDKSSESVSFVAGFTTQFLNPKAWLFSMSGISVFVSPNQPEIIYYLLFCLVSFMMCFTGVGIWASIGQMIKGLLSTPDRQIGFNRIMGLLLCMTVMPILFGEF